MDRFVNEATGQIGMLEAEYAFLLQEPRASDAAIVSFVTGGMAALRRIAGENSVYYTEPAQALQAIHWAQYSERASYVYGALSALNQALRLGYLRSVEELIHASVFADFLEMGSHLLEKAYKDAAAVMIGGVLEGHIKKTLRKTRGGLGGTYCAWGYAPKDSRYT